jgi:hypothetical protein
MPGTEPTPTLHFDPAHQWLTPRSSDHAARGCWTSIAIRHAITARCAGAALATSDVVLPVSDELNCKACHARISSAAARPFDDWSTIPTLSAMRPNTLRLHDDLQSGTLAYASALASADICRRWLFATASAEGGPCARWFGGAVAVAITPVVDADARRSSYGGGVGDPVTAAADAPETAAPKYWCHPGSRSDFPRGAMTALPPPTEHRNQMPEPPRAACAAGAERLAGRAGVPELHRHGHPE